MALQLETLSFVVDSSQLDEARIKLAKLGDAVNALNRPMQEMQRSSAKTAEAIAKSELAAEKARVAKEKLADSASTVTAKVDPLTKLMEKLSNTYTDMAAGMTRGESSILNQARSYGAMGDQLKAVADILQNIKTLNKDPFDASLGGVRSITQEFERLQQRADLAAQGILMTAKQLGEYSKLAAEARGRVVGLGMDPDSLEGQKVYNQLLSQSQKEYLDVLSVVKQLTDAEQQRLAVAKEQERLQKAAASASAARMQEWAKGVGGKSPELSSMAAFYKEQEVAARKLTAAEDDLILREQKLAFVNKELAAGLTTASANALFTYKKDLEALGKSTDEVTKRTSAFRAGLVEKQGHSPIKQIADDAAEARKQVDHLARALGAQITDIFVGLATGQSPLTVLLQQGGQLRDQFALAGVEGTKMGNALVTSAKYMITSIKDVSLAVGTLLGTAIINLGATAGTVLTKMTGDFFIIEGASAALSKSFPGLAEHIKNLGTAMHFFTGSIAIATFIGLAIAFKQIVQEESALSRALLTTGAAMGFTKQSAIEFAQSLEGVSESKAKDFLTELAKNSVENTGNLKELTKTAVDLEKYAGISLEETAKRYAELQKNPVEALTKLAIETGRVNVKTLEQAESMKEAKNYTDLAALANQEFARAMGEVAAAAYQNMSPIEKIFASIKSEATAGWTAFKEWANTPEVLKVVEIAWRGVSGVFTILLAGVKQIITGIGAISTALEKLGSLDLSGAWDSLKDGWEKIQAIGKDAMKDAFRPLTTGTNFAPGTSAAGDTTANARAAKAFEQQKKDRESARKELESDAKKQENYYKKVLDAANNYYEKMIGSAEELTQAEIRLQQLENDPEWKNLSKERQQKLKDIWLQNAALERQYKLTQEQRKVDIAAGEARNKLISDGIKEVETIQQRVKDQEIALGLLEYENSLIGTTQSQREYLVALKKEELEYEKRLAEIKAKGYLSGQESDAIAALDREFELRKKILSASTYQKEFKEIQKSLGDVMYLALTGKGAQAGKKLRDLIKAELMKPITVVINAVIGEVFGGAIASVLGALGINVPAGLTGNAGSIIKGVSSAKDIYSTVTGGFNPVGAATSLAFNKFATSSFGQSLGLSQQVQVPVTDISATGGAPVTETVASTQMTELGNSMSASLGQIATSTASMVAGAAMRKMFSGGYSMGKGMETAQSIAMAAAEFFFPGIGGAVAGAVSGLMNRAFGRKLKEVGIVGTFSGEQGFTGQQYKYEKGGLFRSDKTSYSALDQDTTDSLTKSFRAIQIAVGTLATSLGASTKSIEDFSYSMKLNLKGLSDLDIQKKITAEFTTMQEKMSQGVLQEWAKTKVKIDPAVQARIDEINSKLQGSVVLSLGDIFNNPISWLGFIKNSKLRRELNGITEDIAAQADDVWKSLLRTVDDKGTMETAVQLLERLSNTLATVNGAFDTLGYSLLQLSIDSAVLATNLTDAFGGVDKFSESMSFFYKNFYTEQERTTTLTRQLTTAFAKLGYELPKTTYEFRDLMQAAIEGGNYGLAASLGKLQTSFIELVGPVVQLEESFKQLTNGILEEVNRLRGENLTDSIVQGTALRAEFDIMSALARGGDITALAKLPEYSQAIEKNMMDFASSASDVIFARALLAQSLSDTMSSLGGNTTIVPTSVSGLAGSTSIATTGAADLTASVTSQGDLVSVLIAEIQGLRAEVRADVSANTKTSKILERANQDGETLSVTVVA